MLCTYRTCSPRSPRDNPFVKCMSSDFVPRYRVFTNLSSCVWCRWWCFDYVNDVLRIAYREEIHYQVHSPSPSDGCRLPQDLPHPIRHVQLVQSASRMQSPPLPMSCSSCGHFHIFSPSGSRQVLKKNHTCPALAHILLDTLYYKVHGQNPAFQHWHGGTSPHFKALIQAQTNIG